MRTDAAVLLINPRRCSPSSMRLPLSLLNLAAVLEGRRPWRIVDGNLDPDAVATALAIRAAFPALPIVWGGYFPTLYPEAAINAPYVDYLVRGQGGEVRVAESGALALRHRTLRPTLGAGRRAKNVPPARPQKREPVTKPRSGSPR